MTATSISKSNAVLRSGLWLLITAATACSAADETEAAGGDMNDANRASELRWARPYPWHRNNPRPITTTPDPIAPGGSVSNPGTGVASANPGPFNNGRCTANGPVTGPCSSYGDQCIYDTSTGTHYCTCLVSAPSTPGVQGWSCR